MSSSSKPVNVSPLSGSNFNPFATHPFTSYSPPAPRAPPPPRNPTPSHSHNTMGRMPPKPPKISPTAGTPAHRARLCPLPPRGTTTRPQPGLEEAAVGLEEMNDLILHQIPFSFRASGIGGPHARTGSANAKRVLEGMRVDPSWLEHTRILTD
ncbi:hypothetical protein C8F04DRAFT_1233611 [Mycena alexandri]|uniref:Uncharacterized protein n=1 Tax=Mycena alexandri TaxID=1745969 RepID=A0AAD6X5H3_9AGAR|nr:hypothetical protein C8F04DRAFT_1233611 [Mycena alexandri]